MDTSPENPQLLFLMRQRPGSIGGVQSHCRRLVQGLNGAFDIETVQFQGPAWASVFYFPGFYRQALNSRALLVHCDDALTALIGRVIRAKSDKAVVATVHGHDVTLPFPWYQEAMTRALKAMDAVVCVSRATAAAVRRRGIDPGKIHVIPNSCGEIPEPLEKNEELYQAVENLTGINLRGRKVLFSLGRPVRRKGFDFFIREVFPHLPPDCVYIVAGPKITEPRWSKPLAGLVGRKWVDLALITLGQDSLHEQLVHLSRRSRVHYLTDVSDRLRRLLFAASDLFIMPNRRIYGDMEGFGIVALEASACGLPVVATGIEGITDAVVDGRNGFCVPENDPAAMVRIIKRLLENPVELQGLAHKAAQFCRQVFSPARIASQYEALFHKILADRRPELKCAPPGGGKAPP
ncbi:MAG: glycosyltransferase family 4 protein [Deltaproteobacteria bacterium]|nr:glycosyltransferase family 4 protein [Deltaproteobacteria bacterium]